MYEELVKSLKICGTPALINEKCIAFHDGCCEAEPVCMYELMREAADAIEEEDMAFRHLEREYKALCAYLPKWIPVTERLPEICERDVNGNITFSEKVWSCTDFGGGFYWQQTDQYTTNCGGRWLSEVPEDGFTPKVVAWMPLPEPPKEGE